MKKSSLKNYITLLEAAADSATHARDYWMREHERRVEALTRLQEKNKIAELKADAAANASDYWARQHELKRRLDEAENEIDELRADNERLRMYFSDCTEHNYSFERDHNDTQA